MSPLLPNLSDSPSGIPRLSLSLLAGLGLGLFLFWCLQLLLQIPAPGLKPKRIVQVVEIVQVEEEKPVTAKGGGSPPPSAPPPPSVASLSEISVPVTTFSNSVIDASMPDFSPNLEVGSSFGSAFSGFSGAGTGSGAGSGAGSGSGNGFGTGRGFKGETLVPLTTQRPQNPPIACQQAIKGWVQLVFVVTGEGRVSDIRIVDAQPKGIFEQAAIAGVSTWLYDQYRVSGKLVAREVTQRIEFDPEDCKYNWN